jgi:outer membrane protein OmpA-like peptidoglycan-associated protein
MTPSCVRATLAAVFGALLISFAANAAIAVDERAWLSLEGGADLYDPEQALRDGPGFGIRAAGFANRWLGVEGLLHRASPSQDPTTLGNATYTHYGVGLILSPDRTKWILPYLYGGIGSAKVDRDGFSSKSSGAYHAGFGAVFRVGERLGIRLDGRDVSYKQDDGPGRATRVNVFQISSGVTAFWMGRPRDTDEDGVPNKRDRCPDTPKGAVVDAGGCPLDTDKDKVYDGLDKCPNTPIGAIVDANGCPTDADGDGVPDGIDQCNDTPKGVLVDAKGCSLDTDADGVPDGPDKCPGTPKGAHVDTSGCPLDADLDGVPDGIDICPFTPAGVAVNAGGCPITPSYYERQLFDDWVIRLTDLEFVPDSAALAPQGIARVDSVAQVLAQWPMLRFEVAAHSDNTGEEGARQPLTQLRARTVLQRIYAKYPSLNAKNYWYVGYGDTQPIASNRTPAGRALNRRVEFRLMSMDLLTSERERREAFGSTPAPSAPATPAPPESAPVAPPPAEPTPPAPQPQGQMAPKSTEPGGGTVARPSTAQPDSTSGPKDTPPPPPPPPPAEDGQGK